MRPAMSHRVPSPTISEDAPDNEAIRIVARERLILGAYLNIRQIHAQGNLISLSVKPYYTLQPQWWETPIMAKEDHLALYSSLLLTQGTIIKDIALYSSLLLTQGITMKDIALYSSMLLKQGNTMHEIALLSHQLAMQGYIMILLGKLVANQDQTTAMLARHGNPIAIKGKLTIKVAINRHPTTVSNSQVITTRLVGTIINKQVAHHRLLLPSIK
jgi:hypothetical protein